MVDSEVLEKQRKFLEELEKRKKRKTKAIEESKQNPKDGEVIKTILETIEKLDEENEEEIENLEILERFLPMLAEVIKYLQKGVLVSVIFNMEDNGDIGYRIMLSGDTEG